eukprot:1361991-Rhodomonas_salina.1
MPALLPPALLRLEGPPIFAPSHHCSRRRHRLSEYAPHRCHRTSRHGPCHCGHLVRNRPLRESINSSVSTALVKTSSPAEACSEVSLSVGRAHWQGSRRCLSL